jgi:tubulin gamma
VSNLFLSVYVKQLFQRTLLQYDRLKRNNAFIDNYRKEPMFADSLEEFDHAREVVQSVVDEYKASESINYGQWGAEAATGADGDVRMGP